MPSINVNIDPDAKQMVATLSEGDNSLTASGIDIDNNPEYLKNYNNLLNKPSINGITLEGDIDSDNLDIMRPLTNAEIDAIMVVPTEEV